MANDLTTQVESTPSQMLTAAIEKGIDADGIVKLAEVFERMEAARAKREFTAAMVAFKADCPAIIKDTPGHHAKFAPLWKIKDAVDPVLEKHGFALDWTMELLEEEKKVRVVVTLAHVGGHEKKSLFTAPIDPAPKMSQTHATASADSFAVRYAIQGILGIAPGFDDDGQRATASGILPPEQIAQLRRLIEETDSDIEPFWNFAKVQKVEDIPASDFGRIYQMLMTKRRNMAEAQKGGEQK